jgi:hypothetical protein
VQSLDLAQSAQSMLAGVTPAPLHFRRGWWAHELVRRPAIEGYSVDASEDFVTAK